MKRNKLLLICLMGFTLLFQISCKKEAVAPPTDNGLLANIIRDNLNLKMFETLLVKTNRRDKLKEKGPFTLLVPSDKAFTDLGFAGPAALLNVDVAYLARIADFHTFNEIHDLSLLPVGYNQPIEFIKARKYYFTKQITGKDTVTAINGAKLLPQVKRASNGILYVLSQVIEANQYADVTEALGNASNTSLFNFALKQAGMLTTLQNVQQNYTIFAPDNAAMQQLGFVTLEDIRNADPTMLVNFVKAHLITGFHFIVDYELQSYPENSPIMINSLSGIQMMAENVAYYIYNNPNAHHIVLKAPHFQPGEEAILIRQDVLCGNGIVHVLNKPLAQLQ
ncbi:fasciclin domain-containing protein [Pedobacter caeni]|uniref:Uncaracterized surface protein containing fasciclin (FAS1) repeats n=1 Tax=Pedobacter caeni TaxID=288992 RepID=A0A1M5BXE7_9SPHI|nr:fasciclin domain-containing protein [Pedobacter caeni]SHF47198.1 Uncaracterized surface protein containing fasciclin (FAS1) repeats [Pedobacter caeni]